jgi:activator of HSP90 ATPase
MDTRNIRQSVTIRATPHAVYEALMDSRKHTKMVGARSNISRQVGGKFSAFDGYAEGVNLELVPDQKIVQTWRASDWPAGHYSKVTFSLKEVESGTRLSFSQTGVPEDQYEDILQGWKDYYWQPMKEMLENSNG